MTPLRRALLIASIWIPYSIGSTYFCWQMYWICAWGLPGTILVVIVGGILAGFATINNVWGTRGTRAFQRNIVFGVLFWTAYVVSANIITMRSITHCGMAYIAIFGWIVGALIVYFAESSMTNLRD